ncbi:hypothetical protein MNEG_16650, partial [Monoraphidium neglectum]
RGPVGEAAEPQFGSSNGGNGWWHGAPSGAGGPSSTSGAGARSSAGAGGGALERTVTRSDVSLRLMSPPEGAARGGLSPRGAAAGLGGAGDQPELSHFEAAVAAAIEDLRPGARAARGGAHGPPAAAAAAASCSPGAARDVRQRVLFLARFGFLLDDVVGDEVEDLLKLTHPRPRGPKRAAAETPAGALSAAARAVARCTPGAAGYYAVSAVHRLAMAALFGGFHYRDSSETQ